MATDHAEQRRRMVKTIRKLARTFGHGIRSRMIDPRVLEVMGEVPRHVFVPEVEAKQAYSDQPLLIGHGQTISQPFIVALMTSLARIGPEHRVLEVGTGSGYQTAVLARLAAQVFSIELNETLAARATKTLAAQGITNVVPEVGDGHRGLPDRAPFDAILVTAAPAELPQDLVQQLKPGGRLVIPVGETEQTLRVIERGLNGEISDTTVVPVRFVPLV